MKKVLCTLVLAMVAMIGFSQARIDVRAGMSITNLTKSEMDAKVGYTLGVGIDLPVATSFSVQSGLMFTGKGAKKGDLKATPCYLDIPILAAYKMPIADDVNFVVNAGPYIGIGLGGKVKYDDLKSDYFGDDGAKRFDLGLQYGVGAEFGDHILLNLSGQYGFISPFEDSDEKNLGFFLTVGYRF